MPTKTEQADLNMALFGRHGEAPAAVIAPRSPADCFYAALEAARIALTYRTPVLLLSDGYLANGSEPWLLPEISELPDLTVEFATAPTARTARRSCLFSRSKTLARPWAIPSTPGLGTASAVWRKPTRPGHLHDPANHDLMVRRSPRIEAIDVPDISRDPDCAARVLVLGWGSPADPSAPPVGHCASRPVQRSGAPAPPQPDAWQPRDGTQVYDRVIIPEMNLGSWLTSSGAATTWTPCRTTGPRPAVHLRGAGSMLKDVVKNV
jgi:2-oxoglutarate ferredoxin oxidoreductase subunit alpha